MFKVNNKKNRLICMCSNLKINTAWHHSGAFIVDFDHTYHISIVFVLLTSNKYLSVGCEAEVLMFWKHKKRSLCFIVNVARPISFSNLSLHPIEMPHKSFSQLNLLLVKVQLLWSCAHYFQCFTGYLNHVELFMSHVPIMDVCFNCKFALGVPSE